MTDSKAHTVTDGSVNVTARHSMSVTCSEANTPTGDELRDAIDHVEGAVNFQDAINPEAVRVVIDAALRAAAAIAKQGEGVTIPENLSKKEELGPAIRKLLVGEARAENLRRDGDNARTLRDAVTKQGGET